MSDLVSRSEVNAVIDELEVYTSDRPNTMKVEVSVLQLQRYINKLRNIPIAYDVDNVVEQLQKLSDSCWQYAAGIDRRSIGKARAFDKAIEIVKSGRIVEEDE